MSYYQTYPKVEIKPLNFDDTMTDDEHDENDGPISTYIDVEDDVKNVSRCSEKILLDESTFLNCSSNSTFTVLRKNLYRPDYANSTPGPIRIMRKRKYAEAVTTHTTLLPHMPNEILNRVFSFCNKRDLLAIGSTCKRFYDVTSTQTHWTKINLCGKKVPETALHRMISRKSKSLCMISCVVFLDPILLNRTFVECNLTRLDLSWAKFPDIKVMKGILSRCMQLQYLGLESQSIDSEILEMVAKNRDLLVLNLSSCQVIDAESLSRVFESCNKLTDLNLSWTYPDEATSAVIINEIPSSIERFAISGMSDRIAFHDAGLIKILSRLPNLTELDIGDNNGVTSTFILELGKRKNFRILTACRCFGIEPIAFTTLKYVRVMNIFGTINSTGFDYMKSILPNLSLNVNPFTTIGRSQHELNQNLFWNDDISEPY
uniref:F-box domain-containing protein n=1 Tax=Panagrolaimus sp. ES5 TaxID=591445 RepID=A0AC34GPJ8_9BILA